jgi:predicted RNA-binding Zn-ribbon protein involved in translation (DUF1610 family)
MPFLQPPIPPPPEPKRFFCHSCKNELFFEVKMQRTDSCPHCGNDLHACKNCKNWDPGAHNQCREPIAEHIHDRERTNFCTYFEFLSGEREGDDAAKKAKSKLDTLFKFKK